MDQKHQDLIFVPLDLPKIEFDRATLEQWYDSNKTRGMEEYVASIGYPWNVVWLRDEDRGLEWHVNIEEIFPNLMTTMALLPHMIFRKVYILEQVIDVAPHRDVSREDDLGLGPSTYRSMLINDDPETFYYYKGTEKGPTDTPIFPKFPEERMWFCHNNYTSRHGAFLPKPPNRKLIFCVWGHVQRKAHEDLIARSYEKYKEWAI